MADLADQRDARISVKGEADDSVAKVAEIGVRAGKVRTPARALYLSAQDPLSESRAIQLPQIRGINEIYRRISSQIIDEIDSDLEAQKRFQSRVLLAGSLDQLSDEVLITVLSLEERGKDRRWRTWRPSSRQIDYLVDFLCGIPANNVVVPPVIPDASGEAYLAFVKEFIRRLPSHERATVAGLIPNLSHRDVTELLRFYFGLGLTSYVLDFRGKPPTTNWPLLPAFSAHLGRVKREYGPHYSHALNVRHGLRRDRSGMVPARDVMLFAECFDTFGGPHTIPPMSREFMRKIEEGEVEPAPPKIFDPELYAYRSEDLSASALRQRFRKLGIDGSIPPTHFLKPDSRSSLCKVLNAALTGTEARVIGKQIIRGHTLPFLKSKSGLTREVPRIDEVVAAYKDRRTTRLDEFI